MLNSEKNTARIDYGQNTYKTPEVLGMCFEAEKKENLLKQGLGKRRTKCKTDSES